jgi:hypothetical protein
MQISNEAKELVELKYFDKSREIIKRLHNNISRLQQTMQFSGAMQNAIDKEYINAATELGDTLYSLYFEAFVEEGLLPREGDWRKICNNIETNIKKDIPSNPQNISPRAIETINKLPIRFYEILKNKIKIIELEQKKTQKRDEAIKSELQEIITSPIMDFSFVANARMKAIIERDYSELEQLSPEASSKSVLILAGGIIEGLLIDALIKNGYWTEKEAFERSLKELIHPAKSKDIITHDNITDVLRVFRNLVHPAREIRDNLGFTVDHARHARTSVNVIISEVRQWHIKNP